ncbi:MAG TPA: PAS domain-containing protein [Novosphingobium sp.]|nr:PAS domain-containing protein [Novosphingobium sp.]
MHDDSPAQLSALGVAPDATDETARQRILASYPFESPEITEQLDRLADLAARICETPIALVSFVEERRQVFHGRSGTPLRATPREQSFCAHAMFEAGCMTVPDATRDHRFQDNPLVTGAPAIRFYAGQPLKSAEGAPMGSLCVIDDKPRPGLRDDQLRHLETLAAAAMGLLERGRLETRSDRRESESRAAIDQLTQRFNVLADVMPHLVWSTDHRGMADYYNRGWCEFTGRPAQASYGAGWISDLHPEDRRRAEECWGEAVRGGTSYEVEYRLRNGAGEYRWMLARGEPVADPSGAITRWIGTCTDIHEQKASEERLHILSRELNHRIKNIFAVIGGLIALTVRRSPEAASAGRTLQERVLALGRAHDFVRTHSGPDLQPHPHSSLKGMLQTLLEPYQEASAFRIAVKGDDIAIDDRSATPLALLFHELATNAVKYGALSEQDGSVAITVRKSDPIVLTWEEAGGPPVVPSAGNGFGTNLIEMSVTRQLGGSLEYDWRRSGLRVIACIPASAMMR